MRSLVLSGRDAGRLDGGRSLPRRRVRASPIAKTPAAMLHATAAMTLEFTVAVLACALGVLGLSILRDRRGRDAMRPALIPSWLVQFVAVTAAVLMLAHLVTLVTGQPFAGRLG